MGTKYEPFLSQNLKDTTSVAFDVLMSQNPFCAVVILEKYSGSSGGEKESEDYIEVW